MTLVAQQHRISSSCHRHPTKALTGFCAACLRERLAGIDPDTHLETPVTHLAAELRRSKSFSSTTNPNASSTTSAATTDSTTTTGGAGVLRRKSCDVKPRGSLSDLFDLERKRRHGSFSRKAKGLDWIGVGDNGEIGVSNVIPGEEFEEDGEFRTMKEFIDLECEKKKHGGRDFRSFWEVASSTLSKKLGILPRKQNSGKRECDKSAFAGMEATCSRFGRRSCDTDARLSVDAARLSIDDFRYSFDEPRASCDGYFIGRTCPRLAPLVPVVEDGKLSTDGGDGKMSCDGSEDVNETENEGGYSPGGTLQTRDYYSDRRKSFDRLSLNKTVGLVDEDVKSVMNAKVSPETVGLFHGAKLLVTEKELRDSNWYSTKGGDIADPRRKDSDSIVDGVDKKGYLFKKSQRWRGVWNMWGLIQGKTDSKCGVDESNIGGSMESWQKLSVVANGEADGVLSQKLVRSYTVSARESSQPACSTTSIDAKKNGMKSGEDTVLQGNQSARYSPNNLDNGLLRFYLTPLRSYGRSKSGKGRLKNNHSMAR